MVIIGKILLVYGIVLLSIILFVMGSTIKKTPREDEDEQFKQYLD